MSVVLFADRVLSKRKNLMKDVSGECGSAKKGRRRNRGKILFWCAT